MICRRCQGTVVEDRDDQWSYLRCVNCGRRHDQLSLDNHYLFEQLEALDETELPRPSDYEPTERDLEPG